MADEIKTILNEDDAKGNEETRESEPRSQERYIKLVDKVKEQSTRADTAEKRAADAEFNLGFREQSDKYPLAKEHEQEIRDTVQKNGLSVEDATTLVLQRQGKLTTREDLDKTKAAEESRGGSAATTGIPPAGKKDPTEMSQPERLAELQELEAKGELGLG